MDTKEELRLFKRSGTAGIWLKSYEEDRALSLLHSLAVEEKMEFFNFNPAQGLMRWQIVGGDVSKRHVRIEPSARRVLGVRDIKADDEFKDSSYGDIKPLSKKIQKDEEFLVLDDLGHSFDEAVSDALRVKPGSPSPVMVVLSGFAGLIEDENPLYISNIRVRIDEYKIHNSMLVILTESEKIPPQLSRVIRLVRMPLPNTEARNDICIEISELVGPKMQENLFKPDRETVAGALAGLTNAEAENVLTFSMVRDKSLTATAVAKLKSTILAKDGLLEFCEVTDSLKSFGGYGALHKYILKRRKLYTKEAREFGCEPPKGILLIGPPGCGKTYVSTIISNVLGYPFCNFKIDRVFGGIVGETEKNMRRVLDQLSAMAPVVAALDEIEKALSGSQSSGQTDGGVTARMMGMLLTWMSDQKEGVYVVGTCNAISDLPPELTRKGRFDEIFYVGLPNNPEREEIIKIHIAKRGRDVNKFDIPGLAVACDQMTGAEIEEMVKTGLVDAFDASVELDTGILLEAAANMSKSASVFGDKLNKLEQWAASHGVKNASFNEDGEIITPGNKKRNIELDYTDMAE